MKNPWEDISLADYENHMKLDSVMQLQAMNEMMKSQFNTYSISSIIIFGIAGYPHLDGVLECLCINLIDEADKLPKADMVIANLLIEYIGYECFQNAVRQVNPKYVSCIIQINMEDNWVSDSPYLHVFDGLERIHHQMEEQTLEKIMQEIDYHAIRTLEHLLPNGKKLVQIDFKKLPFRNCVP